MTSEGSYPTLQLFVEQAVVHTFVLSPGRHYVGRDETMTIQLLDAAVSARHAALTVTESADFPGFFDTIIEDAGSRNGTRVNDEPISLRELEHGDIITVGRTQLRFAEPRSGSGVETGVILGD